jgi:hypothetical protein
MAATSFAGPILALREINKFVHTLFCFEGGFQELPD